MYPQRKEVSFFRSLMCHNVLISDNEEWRYSRSTRAPDEETRLPLLRSVHAQFGLD